MAQAKPEKSCNDTVLKYVIENKDLEAAKAQILKAAGNTPVVFMEIPLAQNRVELMALASSLTPSQKKELEILQQDGVMVKRIAEAHFEGNQVSFDLTHRK
ncbi:hypothetical protein COW36_09735 [bacterium (Candidatus Blackallbacteria) CG17_big_fil_post_rev_8_21_14_2_50_48_46]|uniref:Uncharacterized protein n=1 Tax=bacterium (Candidatus Blackallbacteria) CG17_big_fil_post_rev_8_21_14_2_50_48_46 TaxID=2014261 RepID=A0A2M7G6I3_9BACT|nr:MAG: hypothetical protein COW64_01675 [bacterium (Candidatus Blackallbacteria) CG18_big_fil_WC_8_21_14_2_50_49_26]PIW17240.1 MAG: hypothetical protein COW36_09735 [bacterium (Candidatus Blackallbacteria) CG17_big_fil_post_rev_8_21_14_2_50_48_46]PIW51032.1 MAG: hypothetical protein COW20_00745 [bacterium (Candidatus Blackallbacteria) CG13_big_fil_rev_8_21_14_2_50_49_14]